MAIFYDHIKGLAATDSASDLVFQYLKWQPSTTANSQSQIPVYQYNNSSYGHLVVSGNISQTLEGALIFSNTTTFNGQSEFNAASKFTRVNIADWTIFPNIANELTIQYSNTDVLTLSSFIVTVHKKTVTEDNIEIESGDLFVDNGDIYLGNNTSNNKIYQDSTSRTYSIKVSGHVEAAYFNATSDQRLKTNVQSLPSVLSFVCNTPIYSFNYIGDNRPSIGVMAQDVDTEKYGNFKLTVADAETGYLSVHESKFIYVLWKAIQEQQEEIEKLKTEIEKLKKTEN